MTIRGITSTRNKTILFSFYQEIFGIFIFGQAFEAVYHQQEMVKQAG